MTAPRRRYRIEHLTEYCYAQRVGNARHRAHLSPLKGNGQIVHQESLSVNLPLAGFAEGMDYFGNRYTDFSIGATHRQLIVSSTLDVSVTKPRWPAQSDPWAAEGLARRRFAPEDKKGRSFALQCAQYLVESPRIPLLQEAADWARMKVAPGQASHEQLLALTQAMFREFSFDPEATEVSTPVAEIFCTRRGVCQDYSQALISALRTLGIPARYVSGYILTTPPPGMSRLIGADATHAWVEAWCAGHGWLALDPTNGKAVTDEYVILAKGRDSADVVPLRGVMVGGGAHSLTVSVTMTPV